MIWDYNKLTFFKHPLSLLLFFLLLKASYCSAVYIDKADLIFSKSNKTILTAQNVKDSLSAREIVAQVIERSPGNHLAKKNQPLFFKGQSKINISPKTYLSKELDSVDVFYSERISEYILKQSTDLHERIINQRTLGFDQPLNQVLATKMHSFNWFQSDFVFFNEVFASPLSTKNLELYDYRLNHIHKNNDQYVIFFKASKKGNFLTGNMIIDKKSFAVQNITIQHNQKISIIGSFTFKQHHELKKWLPDHFYIQMKPGKGGRKFAIFSGLVDLGLLQKKRDFSKDNSRILSAESNYFDYSFTENSAAKQKYHISLTDSTDTRSFSEVDKLKYTKNEKKLINNFEKVNLSEKVKNNIYRITRVNDGFLPVSLWNIDLKTLIKVNNYEGFRLGFGGETNSRLSKRFRFGGYGAYGTKDKKFKYGISTSYKVRKDKNTWLRLNYTDDVREVASSPYLTDERVYSLFEPRLVNIIFFYKEKSTSIRLQSRLSPRLLSDFKMAYDQINTTSNYRYRPHSNDLSYYNLTKFQAGFRWMPNSKYLMANQKVTEVSGAPPLFSLQLTQAYGGNNGLEDFAFTKINLKVDYRKKWYDNSQTNLSLETSLALGSVPLTHAYHAYPNNPVKDKVLDRFSVAGVKSFETMFFNEFFHTSLAFFHAKHQLSPFFISDAIQPELVFISRHGIGDFNDQDDHKNISFSTMENGFHEAGLELNKIYAGFGLSFAYRYGAYHLPNLSDNLSFKFTFYFNL